MKDRNFVKEIEKLRTAVLGYDREEVVLYIRELVEYYGQKNEEAVRELYLEKMQLAAENAGLRAQIPTQEKLYAEAEGKAEEILGGAKETAATILDHAGAEKERMLKEAEEAGKKILAEADQKAVETITDIAEGIYTEKRSKFIAIAIPVRTIEEIKQHLDTYQKKYYDARHVCYAYMLGHERKDFRANDNGEPSGTAGKPILGQINSNELTDILIIVVRYFGGIKLGTSGLIVAYKAAAAEAIAAADIVERTVDEEITVSFEYPFMNDIMRIVKEDEPAILEQSYDMDCLMRLRIRKSMMGKLRARLEKVETARIIE